MKAAAETFRGNPNLDETTAITELAVGEALVSFLDEKGTPGLVERAFVVPPAGQLGPITPEERAAIIRSSVVAGHYEKMIDRESAYEILTKKAAPDASARGCGPKKKREEFQRRREEQESESKETKAPARRSDSIFMTFCKSAVRTIGNAFGRIIERGILGSILGGTKRKR